MRNNTKAPSLARKGRLTDAKLLLIITICVFAVMYVCAVLFLGSGFKKAADVLQYPQRKRGAAHSFVRHEPRHDHGRH